MRKYRKKQFAKKFVPVPQYGKGAKKRSSASGAVPSAKEAAALVASGGKKKKNAAQPSVGIFPASGPARISSSSAVAVSVALLAGAISLIAML